VGIDWSVVSVRRSVLLLTKSGIRFRHCFVLASLLIANTVTNASGYIFLIQFVDIGMDVEIRG